MNNIKVRAQSAPWNAAVEFLVMEGRAVARPIIMEERPEGQMVNPTFSLGMTEAQVLMDDLWNAGLRPTEGTGSAGALVATERHLQDMRRIVFDNGKYKE